MPSPGRLQRPDWRADRCSTPGAVKDGACIFSTHSLRATTATLLLDADIDIRKVQELLGYHHTTTTQICDKRRRTIKESASHDVLI
jgi:integrase